MGTFGSGANASGDWSLRSRSEEHGLRLSDRDRSDVGARYPYSPPGSAYSATMGAAGYGHRPPLDPHYVASTPAPAPSRPTSASASAPAREAARGGGGVSKVEGKGRRNRDAVRDAADRQRYSSPSPSSAGTPGTGGSSSVTGRSLHDKLSSPDRQQKKDLSPTEARRRHEAKISNAELNRDKSVAERVQKAAINSERVRRRSEKEAQRIAQAVQALEGKLRGAEQRKSQHLKQVQQKASNENSKVSEVVFINTMLNSEAIAERLEEVEARILAASRRRQERLLGITVQQKKKTVKRAEQISEWRLQFEREKMERWGRLQERLEAVRERRLARLAELQKHAEELGGGSSSGGSGSSGKCSPSKPAPSVAKNAGASIQSDPQGRGGQRDGGRPATVADTAGAGAKSSVASGPPRAPKHSPQL